MTERLVQLTWLRLPLLVAQRWPTGGLALADGHYLVRWPLAGLLAPPVAFLLGVVLAALQGDVAYTSSLLLLLVLGLVALAGAALGLWATTGLGLGLLLFGNVSPFLQGPAWVFQGLLPALLSFVILGLLTVLMPLAMNRVRAAVRGSTHVPERLRLPVEIAGAVVTVGFATYVWSAAAPLLIRPIFVWAGRSPTVEAVAPLQQRGIWLAVALALAAAGRVLLERQCRTGRTATFSLVLGTGLAQQSHSAIPARVRALLGAVSLTLLLSGLIADLVQAALVFAFFAGLLLLRLRLIERPPVAIGAFLRIPRPVRLGLGLLAAYLASRAVLGFFWVRTETFLPVLVATCTGVALITLLGVEGRWARSPRAGGEPTADPVGGKRDPVR